MTLTLEDLDDIKREANAIKDMAGEVRELATAIRNGGPLVISSGASRIALPDDLKNAVVSTLRQGIRDHIRDREQALRGRGIEWQDEDLGA